VTLRDLNSVDGLRRYNNYALTNWAMYPVLYESAKKAGCDELLSEALKTEVSQSKMKLATDGLGSSEYSSA